MKTSARVRACAPFTRAVKPLTMECVGDAVPEEPILETEDLTKEFAGFVAVRAVNLRVTRGSIHALIGPNGAGKTTCFNLLTKFLARPRTHRVRRPRYHRDEASRRCATRACPLVPDFGGISASHGARECAGRAAATARPLLRFLALERARPRTGTKRSSPMWAFALTRRAGGGIGLWTQAGAGNRHDVGARSGTDAARRTDGRHGPRRYRAISALIKRSPRSTPS